MSLLHEIHGLSECFAPGDCPFSQSYKTNDNVLNKNTESSSVARKLNCKDKNKKQHGNVTNVFNDIILLSLNRL